MLSQTRGPWLDSILTWRVSYLDNFPVVLELNRIIFDSELLQYGSSPETYGYLSRREPNVPPELVEHFARAIDPENFGEFPGPSSPVSYRDLNPLSFDSCFYPSSFFARAGTPSTAFSVGHVRCFHYPFATIYR